MSNLSMLHLLTPPRVRRYPSLPARFLRGGGATLTAHALLLSLLALAASVPLAPPPRSSRTIVVSTLQAASATPSRREPEKPFREQPDEQAPSTIPLTVRDYVSGDAFTIDLARIRQRRNDLFPFVTWDLRALGERPETDPDRGIDWPSAFSAPSASAPKPLSLSDGALQALIDRAWSRRERWTNLAELVDMADRYDANEGDLARAFNGYVTQNVPQPYEDWDFPDPVFWMTVTLAADDAPVLEFAMNYLKRHPVSRVTTELLFLLDGSAETSCDVLGDVLRVGTAELPLSPTRVSNPDAYELAESLASAYRSWILRYRVNAAERCVAARTAVLRRIIETSPDRYGAADARFRLGALLWNLDKRDEAVRWWRGMVPDERGEYARGIRALLGAIADGAAQARPTRISGILIDEERRWRERAGDRLDYFGWTADKF